MRRYCVLFVILSASILAAQTPVILISIDTLRADHLSAYGYQKVKTPELDAFADHGTIFKNVDSQIPLTLPSHTSLFTSTYPFENGVEENAEIVPQGLVTLASVLQEHGYRTAAFIGSDLLAQRYKLDRGFDLYDSPFHAASTTAENPYDVRVRRDGALVIRSASQWLNTPSEKPPFVFLHLFDMHAPYKAAAHGSIQPNAAGYDAELQYVDQLMGRLRRMLVAKGWWNKSLVVLLSDHGESLGEHGEASHGYFIYQSTLWVPLLIHWPAASQPLPHTSDEPAGLISVAPTILDYLHIQKPPSFRGTSLLLPVAGRKVYSESMYAHDAFRWSALRSLREGTYEYVDAPRAELYELKSDPAQRRNVIESHALQARELRNSLHSLLARMPRMKHSVQHDASPGTENALQSLGYVATANRQASGGTGADPKDRLPEYHMYEHGLEDLYEHREQQSIGVFKQLLKQDPQNTIARYYLGEAYFRSHQSEEAIQEWKAALQQDPQYLPAAEALQRENAGAAHQ